VRKKCALCRTSTPTCPPPWLPNRVRPRSKHCPSAASPGSAELELGCAWHDHREARLEAGC
jgi:hypothetical protein